MDMEKKERKENSAQIMCEEIEFAESKKVLYFKTICSDYMERAVGLW